MIRYQNNLRRSLPLFLCVLISLMPGLSSYADEVESLEQQTNSLRSELEGLNKELVDISEQIDQTKTEITVMNSAVARTDAQLAQAEQKQETQYEDMKARIKYMYENGNSTMLEWLFCSRDMADFINKAHFIHDISEYDQKMLDELVRTGDEIRDKKEALEAQQKNLVTLEANLTKQQETLQTKANETSTNLEDFQVKLAAAKEEKARRIAEEEARRKEALAREQAAKAAAEQAAQDAAKRAQQAHPPGTSSSSNSSSSSYSSSPGQVVNIGNSHATASDDVTLFAAILQCEAYQDYNSLMAVATVIMNRVESPRFGNTLHDVIYASGQFEPVSTGRLDKVLQSGPTSLSMQVAKDALAGSRLDSVIDCYYFLYAPAAVGVTGVIIGDNIFFQNW